MTAMKYVLVSIGIWSLAITAHAAMFSVSMQDTASTAVRIPVDVYVDPEGESINSVDVTVAFPTDILIFAGYDQSSGSIPLWVVPPTAHAGTVEFSGVIPGGLERMYDPEHRSEHRIRITRLFFVASTLGKAEISIPTAIALRNDGKGTSIATTSTAQPFRITAIGHVDADDTNPPEDFTITLIERSRFGKSPMLALFGAHDRDTGIEHYEVRVGRGAWQRATSPFAVPSRIFSYTLGVRAVDYSGEVTEEQIVVPGVSAYKYPVITVVVLVCVGIYLNKYRKKRI